VIVQDNHPCGVRCFTGSHNRVLTSIPQYNTNLLSQTIPIDPNHHYPPPIRGLHPTPNSSTKQPTAPYKQQSPRFKNLPYIHTQVDRIPTHTSPVNHQNPTYLAVQQHTARRKISFYSDSHSQPKSPV